MSSSDGLEMLKKWRTTDVIVNVLSRGASIGVFLIDTPARVTSITPSELVLSAVDSSETEVIDIRNVKLSAVQIGEVLAVQLKFVDGMLTIWQRI